MATDSNEGRAQRWSERLRSERLRPIDPETLRRMMRAELDSGALAASDRDERIAGAALRLLVERGVMREQGGAR